MAERSSVIRRVVIFSATLLVPLMIFFEPARTAVRAMRNPVSIQGTVVELRSDDHRMVVINYEVKGRTYRSSTSLPESVGLPKFGDIHPGDRVRIVYDPRYPENGVPGDPKKLLIGTLEDFALVGTGCLVFGIVFDLHLQKWLLRSRGSKEV